MKTFKNIYDLRDDIKNLSCYNEMSGIQKKLVIKRNNLKAIENSLNVIKNIGFDKWNDQSNSMYLNKLIINEIKNAS